MAETAIPHRILYLSYDGMTDPLGQSQVLPYLAGIRSAGHQVTVVSFEKPAAFLKNESMIAAQCHRDGIDWRPLVYHKRPPVLSTLYDVWNMRRAARAICLEKRISVVHCRSYLSALVGQHLKHTLGVRWIFDMRGFWADERVEGNLWKLSNPLFRLIYRYFKRKERQFLQTADHVVSLTDNARQEILQWQLDGAPITVIPTCADLKLFDPAMIAEARIGEVRQQLGVAPNDFVLLYLGSWGTWYLTDQVLEMFHQLKQQQPASKLLIITTDRPDLSRYQHVADTIVRSASRQEVPWMIAASEAAICLIKPSFSKKASSATKLGEILAMNKMVFCNGGWGDIETYATQTNCLEILPPTGAAMPLKTVSNPDGRQFVEANLSLRVGIARYLDIYRQWPSSP
ncbi:MAG: glycosyltransferase [Cyclobacteriaceae bacterium]